MLNTSLLSELEYVNSIKETMSNGNRTEWSPIRSVFVIITSEKECGGRIQLVFTSNDYIHYRIGRHEVLLQI